MALQSLRLSPDRKAIAAVVTDQRNTDIWLYELAGGRRTRFTFDPAIDRHAIWSPDGRTIVFSSNRSKRFDLYRKAADASAAEELLYADQSDKQPTGWSPDDRFLLYTTAGGLWVLPLMPEQLDARLKPFLLEQGASGGQFSPDGRWIAYQSGVTGRTEIYVRPFHGPDTSPGVKIQVSATGGFRPLWRRDGREIFFVARDERLTAAEVRVNGNAIEIGEPRPLFGSIDWNDSYYDVSADGQRILAAVPVERPVPQPLTLVQNWTAGLKK